MPEYGWFRTGRFHSEAKNLHIMTYYMIDRKASNDIYCVPFTQFPVSRTVAGPMVSIALQSTDGQRTHIHGGQELMSAGLITVSAFQAMATPCC